MNTKRKILSGAGIAIVAGVVIAGIGVGLLKEKPESETGKYAETTYTASGNIDYIRASLHAEDVVVEAADITMVEVVYMDNISDPLYTVTEKGSKLQIKKQPVVSFFHIPIFYKDGISEEAMSETVHIRVPRECVLDAYLSVTAGDVSIADLEVGQLSFSSTSGNMKAKNLAADKEIHADATAGDMKFENVSVSGDFYCSTTSGSVDMREIRSTGNILVNATSGELELYNIAAEGVISKSSTSGGMKGENISAQTLDFNATSGSIRLEELTIKDKVRIDGTSMDVKVGLTDVLDHYQVRVSTTSGDSNLPNHYKGSGEKEIDVSTTSGDVWFEFGSEY